MKNTLPIISQAKTFVSDSVLSFVKRYNNNHLLFISIVAICWSKKLASCLFSECSQIYSFLVVMENWNTLNPRQIYQIWWIAQICIFSCYRSMLWANGVRGGCPSPRRKYNLPGNISFPFPLVLASNYWLVHLSHHITHCFPAKNYWAPFLPPLHDYLLCF